MNEERKIVFISHANPEDNVFTLWLSSRLTSAGYLVWSDVTKLFGAELFWDDIEEAIRKHSAKVVVVLSRTAQEKAGVLDEIAVAVSVERAQKIERFVVPIRIDDLPFDELKPNLTRKNIIDFQKGWADGFHKLLKVLERDQVPISEESDARAMSSWIEQLIAGPEKIVPSPAIVSSNWFPIVSLPTTLNFFRIPGSPDVIRSRFAGFKYPAYPYRDMIATFASIEDVDQHLPAWQAAMPAHQISLTAILNGDPQTPVGLEWPETSNMLFFLFRTAWDNAMRSKELRPYEMANGKKAWYPIAGYAPGDKAHYADMDGVMRWRKLVGKSDKRQVHWHFGMEVMPSISREPFLAMKPHVVFTEDGVTPIASDKRMHRMRRGFCKSWWNDRWRDLIFAYMSWVSEGHSFIELPVGPGQLITISFRPTTFESPVSLSGGRYVCAMEEASEEFEKLSDGSDWGIDDDIDEEELEDDMDFQEGKES